jgi:hypothetical protein
LFVLFNYFKIPANFLNLFAKSAFSAITCFGACTGEVDLVPLLAIPSVIDFLVDFVVFEALLKFSANVEYTNLTSLSYTYYPTVSGFVLPTQNYKVMNKNAIHITLPEFNNNGKINFVILNPIGWKDTNSIDTSFYYISSV